MIDEPGRRRVDSRWIDDRSGIGRVRNIARRVGSGPWPGAMSAADPFEAVCTGTKALNLISFKKDSGGRSVSAESSGQLRMRRGAAFRRSCRVEKGGASFIRRPQQSNMKMMAN